MSASTTAEAIAFLDNYASMVGFERKDPPKVEAPEISPASAFWRSSYAQILLWPTDLGGIDAAVQRGRLWLDSALGEQEAGGEPIDGYLVILLPEEPAEHERTRLRMIELDPQICRKTIAWPLPGADGEERWARLLRLTVLGLPPPPHDVPSEALDNMSPAQARLLEALMSSGVAPTVRSYSEDAG